MFQKNKVPKEYVDGMMSILVLENKEITPFSATAAKNYVKEQVPLRYQKVLFMGIILETRAYLKRLKKEAKQNGSKVTYKQLLNMNYTEENPTFEN